MKNNRDILHGLEQDLFAAHRQRPAPKPPPDWSWQVMAVAREAALRLSTTEGVLSQTCARLALRLAGAGTMAAAAMLIYVLYWGPDLDLSLARSALCNPLGHAGWQSLWGS